MLAGDTSPVTRSTVTTWLRFVYSRLGATKERYDPEHLDLETKALLVFSDAVGTRPGLVAATAERLVAKPGFSLRVQAQAAAKTVAVRLDLGRMYYGVSSPGAGIRKALHSISREVKGDEGGERRPNTGWAPFTNDEWASFSTAVCLELEDWLHVAFSLELLPLGRALLRFVQAQAIVKPAASLLGAGIVSIFTERVLRSIPPRLLAEAFVRDSLVPDSSRKAQVRKAVSAAGLAPAEETDQATRAVFSAVVQATVSALASAKRPRQ